MLRASHQVLATRKALRHCHPGASLISRGVSWSQTGAWRRSLALILQLRQCCASSSSVLRTRVQDYSCSREGSSTASAWFKLQASGIEQMVAVQSLPEERDPLTPADSRRLVAFSVVYSTAIQVTLYSTHIDEPTWSALAAAVPRCSESPIRTSARPDAP